MKPTSIRKRFPAALPWCAAVLAALMAAAVAQAEKEVTIDLRDWFEEQDPVELLERFGSLRVEDVDAVDKGRPKTTRELKVRGRETPRDPLYCYQQGVHVRALPIENTGVAVALVEELQGKPDKGELAEILQSCLDFRPDSSLIEWRFGWSKIREAGRTVAFLVSVNYRYTKRNPDLELPRRHRDPTRPPA